MSDTVPASPAFEDAPETPDVELPKMSFLDHLEELRKRLIVSIVAIAVAFLACWRFADKIYAWVEAPLTKLLPPGDRKLAYTHLTEPFIIFATAFFVLGGYFGYRVILPGACAFFVETGRQFKQMIKIDEYFGFASMLILAAGVVFETPIL